MIPRSGQTAKSFALVGALCALLSQGIVHAQGTLVVTSSPITQTGALYNYSYAVNYTSPDGGVTDLGFVEFSTAPNAPLSNLTASTGFIANYDPGSGDLVFAEDFDQTTPQTFSNTSPAVFSFSSAYAPATVTYNASDFNTDYSGQILTPAVAPAPEPGGFVTLGAGALGLALLAVRRRASATAS